MALQIRRGTSSELTSAFIPALGEPIYTIDTYKLYIGDGTTPSNALLPINGDISLGDLSDVNASSPIDNSVLVYSSLSSTWEPNYFGLAYLPDVDALGAIDKDVLKYDGNFTSPTYQKFVSGKVNIDELDGVFLSSVTDGEVLTYNALAGSWVNAPASGGGGSSTLDGLTDVSIISPADGQGLIYDSASGTWQNQTLSSGGALSLDNLTDVSASAPNDGDIIAYNASTSTWVTTAAPSGGGGGLSSRTTAFATTASIADGSSDDVTITAAKTYALLTIETSAAAWVTLYTDATSRTNDASRSETTDPLPGSGVLAEVVTTGATTQLMTPGTIGFNYDSPAASSVYAKVVNKSGSTQSITVTLGFVAMEA